MFQKDAGFEWFLDKNQKTIDQNKIYYLQSRCNPLR
jgi:hypothetical protein